MPHPTLAQQREAGRALRDTIPLAALATAGPATRDPMAALTCRDAGRIAWLLGERNARMAATPAAFLRGAATLMAADLAAAPSTPILVQAAGDAHLFNFGAVFSPDGAALFDANDFDETLRAPFEWDIKRLAASLVVTAALAGHKPVAAAKLARRAARAYARKIAALAPLPPFDAWHDRIDLAAEIAVIATPALRARQQAQLNQATAAHRTHFNIIAGTPPKIVIDGTRVLAMPEPDKSIAETAFRRYRDDLPEDRKILLGRYELADIAYKIVGIGSVGTLCAIVLLATPEGAGLLLQVKQAETSALAPHVAASPYANQGQRVVMGQRLMQAAPDLFLGWTSDDLGRDFYIRRLKDSRLAKIGGAIEADALAFYAALCGQTLARAHARSSEPAMIAGYIGGGGKFADAIADFATEYAARTQSDWAIFRAHITSGAISAVRLHPAG
jgi:uncharacterized protein (DUF2252 family)